LSQGRSTSTITKAGPESGVSQVFIAVQSIGSQTETLIEEILAYAKSSRPVGDGHDILYPGENILRTREKSMKNGVWVDEKIWEKVMGL
jgi:3-dehydro-L-gulonate 2-dehydrogenase